MTTEGLHLDGNGIAGTLGEIFADEHHLGPAELPELWCPNGHRRHGAYQRAGVALRRRHCGEIAALVGIMGDVGRLLELRGRWVFGRST